MSEAIDWRQLHEEAAATRFVAALFNRVAMWLFPAFGLMLAAIIWLLLEAPPGAAIFAVASVVAHVVFRLRLRRIEGEPPVLLRARVQGKDRVQSSNSTTQMWRHYVTLAVEQLEEITPDGPRAIDEPPAERRYSCQARVYDQVEAGDVGRFLRLGDGEVAGMLGPDGRLVRGSI